MLQEDIQLEIDPDPELEREAEETARRVMSGGDLGIQRLSDTEIHVQRSSDDEVTRRELIKTGGESMTDAAQAVDDVVDAQALVETVMSNAKEINWVSVLKRAGVSAAKSTATVNAILGATSEIDSQLRDDSVQEDDLIAQLDQRDPPQSWVETISNRAAGIVRSDLDEYPQ